MELFFQVAAGREFLFDTNKEKWVRVQLGSFAMQLSNAWFRGDYGSLREKIGFVAEEEIDRKMDAVASIILFASYGMKTRHLERLLADYQSLPEQVQRIADTALDDIFRYFATDGTLWKLWAGDKWPGSVLPIVAAEGKLGWVCVCETALEAAAREAVLIFMHGWRPSFRFCRNCFQFYFGSCPACQSKRKLKANFQNLLRVHTSREIRKLPPEEQKAAAREINRVKEEIKKHGVSAKVVEDYRSFCEGYGLPLGWYGRYKKRL